MATTVFNRPITTADKVLLNNIPGDLAMVNTGNTAEVNIAKDKLVYVRGHSTLVDGLYQASQAITSGTSLSESNLTSTSVSDQIAGAEKIFINPANALLSKTSYISTEGTYTATENGFLFATQSAKPTTTAMSIKINGTNIAISDSDGTYGKGSVACGFIKKGDVIKYNNCVIKILGLRL